MAQEVGKGLGRGALLLRAVSAREAPGKGLTKGLRRLRHPGPDTRIRPPPPASKAGGSGTGSTLTQAKPFDKPPLTSMFGIDSFPGGVMPHQL